MDALNVELKEQNQFHFIGALNSKTLVKPWQDRQAQWQKINSEIIFDLQGVTLIDTTGLAWLLQLIDECQRANKNLKLVNVPTSLLKLAKMSDVEGFLPLQ